MAENNACITEFLNKNEYLNTTIKQRMTDFIVEEMNEAGKVCQFNPEYKKGELRRIKHDYRNTAKDL